MGGAYHRSGYGPPPVRKPRAPVSIDIANALNSAPCHWIGGALLGKGVPSRRILEEFSMITAGTGDCTLSPFAAAFHEGLLVFRCRGTYL